MNIWLVLAIAVILAFILFRTGKGVYYGRKNRSKYGKFTPKKNR